MLSPMLLMASLIGIGSALLTMVLTPILQHYFWIRQRYTERQFAAIEALNTLAAEVCAALNAVEEMDGDQRKGFATRIVRTQMDVQGLFSPRASHRCAPFMNRLFEVCHLSELGDRATRIQLSQWVFDAHHHALRVLYGDMGIPPRSPWKRFRFVKGEPKDLEPDPLAITKDTSVTQE
jgi:hypothetical protein